MLHFNGGVVYKLRGILIGSGIEDVTRAENANPVPRKRKPRGDKSFRL